MIHDPALSTWPARRAARRSGFVIGGGAVTAVAAGGLATASPVLAAAAVVGVSVLGLVLALPVLAVATAVLSDGIVFPLLISGESTSRLSLVVLFTSLLGLAGVLWRRAASGRVLFWVFIIGALLAPSAIISVLSLPLPQTLSGLRYILVPLTAAVLASTLDDRQVRRLFQVITLLMSVSFVAAIVETALGSDRLLELTHLDYGVSIRNIGSALRAPGTFATNYHLGAYSSVFCVAALLWWGTLAGSSRDIVWRLVATIASLGCLALSTYRTGVVILVVSIVAAVFLAGTGIPRRVKALIVVLGSGVAAGFFLSGLGDTQSLFQRFQVWGDLLAEGSTPLGRGIGYAGAASGAAGSAKQIFTDNYYLSLWLQSGVAGLVVSGIFLVIAGWLVLAGRAGNRQAAVAAPLWIAVLTAFAFVELWEYTSTMALAAAIVGKSLADARAGRDRTVVVTGPAAVLSGLP